MKHQEKKEHGKQKHEKAFCLLLNFLTHNMFMDWKTIL